MSHSPLLLHSLNQALIHRDVRGGFGLLDREVKDLKGLEPSDPHAAALLLCVAQWVDLGYRNIGFLRNLTMPFAELPRETLRLSDYLSLRMVEAYIAFLGEDFDRATEILDFVLRVEAGILEPHLVVLAHLWKCRANRQQGQYELALQHVREAKSLAVGMSAPKLVAAASIHESWLLFQRGQRKEAFRLLDEAEAELKATGHMLSIGNIESARGRYVRRSGEYAKALEHFERAVRIYGNHSPEHPNLARALVNAAYVKRLIALDIQGKSGSGRAKGDEHARFMKLCKEALQLLGRAGEIYSQQHHHSGTGSVLVNAGYLHLDVGDIDRAESEALKAYEYGEERQDHILMARSRILQAEIQNDRSEDQVGDTPDTARHAHLARAYSEDAIALAKLTQNDRLLAGAYVVRGTVAANEFFCDWDNAKLFAGLASELLSNDDLDHLQKQLGSLKKRILRTTGIDEMLRCWSEGIIGDKSFQRVTEEFAELVIPKVWEREGRKISRVAQQLSISPKKVRRILNNAQMLKP